VKKLRVCILSWSLPSELVEKEMGKEGLTLSLSRGEGTRLRSMTKGENLKKVRLGKARVATGGRRNPGERRDSCTFNKSMNGV